MLPCLERAQPAFDNHMRTCLQVLVGDFRDLAYEFDHGPRGCRLDFSSGRCPTVIRPNAELRDGCPGGQVTHLRIRAKMAFQDRHVQVPSLATIPTKVVLLFRTIIVIHGNYMPPISLLMDFGLFFRAQARRAPLD